MNSYRWAILLPLAVLLLVSSAPAEDWPQWRGPNRDGVWDERRIVEEFEEDDLELEWSQPIGPGYSGPTVADDRVFVTDHVLEPVEQERVHCFDAVSGQPLWSYEYECSYEGISYTAGPRAAVTIDDNRAYVLGATGKFHVFDVAGALLWEHDLQEEFDAEVPVWGIAAAPLIYEDFVIVVCGGAEGASVIAFHKKDGTEEWRALDDRIQYSSPILVEQGRRPVVIVWTGDAVVGLDPEEGEELWRHAWPPRNMPIGVATPVVNGDRVFFTSFYDGSLMLRLNADMTVTSLWQRAGFDERNTDALHSIISTPVFEGDYIYGVDSYGELRCLDAENGDRLWESNAATPPGRWSTIHFVKNGDRWFLFNERGDLIIARLSPEGYTEIDRAHLIDPTTVQLRQRGGVCWSHPAFAEGCVFARNDEEIVCADLED